MGDLTALNAAVAQLDTDVTSLITAFQAESDQPAIDAATTAITTLDSQVQQAINVNPVPPAGDTPPVDPNTGLVPDSEVPAT